MNTTIAFIGGGNMARSLIGGLIASGISASHITVAEPDAARRDELAAQFGVRVGADNSQVASTAQALVLAVKPQQMQAVCAEIAPTVQASKPLIISIAAGLRLDALEGWLGEGLALVRCMPNTPALVQAGATALFANAHASPAQKELAEKTLRTAGIALWLEDEAQMDAVTALSGSGPAYFFLVMEAMQRAGEELGLNTETARQLTLQTALGAAKMALQSSDEPAALRRQVTSPGGTTERALQTLEAGGIRDLIGRALEAARDRSRELADELGG